jgi:hypothetical protein
MNRWILSLAVATVAGSVWAQNIPPAEIVVPKPQAVQDQRNGHYTGVVKKITAGRIVIEGEGVIGAGPKSKLSGVKSLEFSETLAKGKPGSEIGYRGYRVKDVKVGDVVAVTFDRINQVEACNSISIRRRPGGRVPPSPVEDPDDIYHHHERMNAYQDLEEKGIPLPFKYDAEAKRRAWEAADKARAAEAEKKSPKP